MNTDQKKLAIDKEVHSYDFAAACGHLGWYERNSGRNTTADHVWLMKEKDTAIFNLIGKHLEVTITRRPSPYLKRMVRMKREDGSWPENVSDHDIGIKFVVRANSGRNYYLMYHDVAGALMVKLENIKKPEEDKDLNEDEKWAETMSYRRVFDTADAVKKAQSQKDNGIYMGERALREVLRQEKLGNKEPTVHEGDSVYSGDIRTLLGIVRWRKEGAIDLPKDYFSENRTDLVVTGCSVCQNIKK